MNIFKQIVRKLCADGNCFLMTFRSLEYDI